MPAAAERSQPSWTPQALPRLLVLNGYRIERVLGHGGFGITYLAKDLLDQDFAIKEYFPRQFAIRRNGKVHAASTDEEPLFDDCRARFLKEAQALVRLGSLPGGADGIVRVLTTFEANGTAYTVMEHLQGDSLQRVLQRHDGPEIRQDGRQGRRAGAAGGRGQHADAVLPRQSRLVGRRQREGLHQHLPGDEGGRSQPGVPERHRDGVDGQRGDQGLWRRPLSGGAGPLRKCPADPGWDSMWLQQIARHSAQRNACLNLIGNISRTGSAVLNERLSTLRAEYVTARLETQAPDLQNRVIASGAGSNDNLTGTGMDDATDALDRRVDFKPIPRR